MKLLATVSSLFIAGTLGHLVLVTPEPRSTNNALTTGPCGVDGDWDEYTEIEPGYYIIHASVIRHGGANYRVALSRENEDVFDCVLLDHVPQYSDTDIDEIQLNVTIPNVKCRQCALQVYQVLPDSDTCCDKDNGECGDAYYSCANVRINGKKDRDELSGSDCKAPCFWPYRDETPGYYSSSTNQDQWYYHTASILRVRLNGSYVPATCNSDDRTSCRNNNDNSQDGNSQASSKGYTTFSDGGKMEAGGVIAIILLIIIAVALGFTYYFKVKPKMNNQEPLAPENPTPIALA